MNKVKNDQTGQALKNYVKLYTVGTPLDSAFRINKSNYMNYLKADSLKGK
jgi:hypothetical protein